MRFLGPKIYLPPKIFCSYSLNSTSDMTYASLLLILKRDKKAIGELQEYMTRSVVTRQREQLHDVTMSSNVIQANKIYRLMTILHRWLPVSLKKMVNLIFA